VLFQKEINQKRASQGPPISCDRAKKWTIFTKMAADGAWRGLWWSGTQPFHGASWGSVV